jgi:mismatch-specific thymine-DNA glycosylase
MREGNVSFATLEDILPVTSPTRLLIVGKRPAPVSVNEGHYLQGRQGTMFWNLLRQHKLLPPKVCRGYEDDTLPGFGYGITDIVKRPGETGDEPSDEEYEAGAQRLAQLLAEVRPCVLLFIYKPPLERMARHLGAPLSPVDYGLNRLLSRWLAAKTFLFPMPGTPCTKEQQLIAMRSLARAVRHESA